MRLACAIKCWSVPNSSRSNEEWINWRSHRGGMGKWEDVSNRPTCPYALLMPFTSLMMCLFFTKISWVFQNWLPQKLWACVTLPEREANLFTYPWKKWLRPHYCLNPHSLAQSVGKTVRKNKKWEVSVQPVWHRCRCECHTRDAMAQKKTSKMWLIHFLLRKWIFSFTLYLVNKKIRIWRKFQRFF